MLKELQKQQIEAARILDTPSENLQFYAWPQVFGSTCGPFNGIGGQTVSTFTIFAFSDGVDAVLFCGQKARKRINRFNPVLAVKGEYI